MEIDGANVMSRRNSQFTGPFFIQKITVQRTEGKETIEEIKFSLSRIIFTKEGQENRIIENFDTENQADQEARRLSEVEHQEIIDKKNEDLLCPYDNRCNAHKASKESLKKMSSYYFRKPKIEEVKKEEENKDDLFI